MTDRFDDVIHQLQLYIDSINSLIDADVYASFEIDHMKGNGISY